MISDCEPSNSPSPLELNVWIYYIPVPFNVEIYGIINPELLLEAHGIQDLHYILPEVGPHSPDRDDPRLTGYGEMSSIIREGKGADAEETRNLSSKVPGAHLV